MTSCLSYFVATLTPYVRKKAKIRPYASSQDPREFHLISLGLHFVGRVDSFLFLDLQFLHPVYMWVEQCRYWKLLLVFIERVRKGHFEGIFKANTHPSSYYTVPKEGMPFRDVLLEIFLMYLCGTRPPAREMKSCSWRLAKVSLSSSVVVFENCTLFSRMALNL